MLHPADSFTHAGVLVEIVPDDDGFSSDPSNNESAGTLYSWARDFVGDKRIAEPDLMVDTTEDWNADPVYEAIDLSRFFADEYRAALTIPLFFADYGSRGATIYVSDDPNCALVFTQKELDDEWGGSADDATKYAEARIKELADWLEGNVYGIVIREHEGGEVLDSVWGFIGNPLTGYIHEEGERMAEEAAEALAEEAAEAFKWACADVVTA